MRHYDKSNKKPWQFKYYVLLGRARLFNGVSSTPNSNRGCQPALYGKGGLAALDTLEAYQPAIIAFNKNENCKMNQFFLYLPVSHVVPV